MQPSYFTAVAAIKGSLGEAVGKMYVARHFPPDAKRRMDVMVKNIIAAYGKAIRDLDWIRPTNTSKSAGQTGGLQREDQLSKQVARLPSRPPLSAPSPTVPILAPRYGSRIVAAALGGQPGEGGAARPLRSPVACTKA